MNKEIILKIKERQLDVIIDALIYRKEALEDVLPFSISMIPVKRRILELDGDIEQLREIKGKINAK